MGDAKSAAEKTNEVRAFRLVHSCLVNTSHGLKAARATTDKVSSVPCIPSWAVS